MINYEIELDLKWKKKLCKTETSRTFGAAPNNNPVRYEVTSQTTRATFQINNAKIYVSLVTLSINDNIKFLEDVKQGFQ